MPGRLKVRVVAGRHLPIMDRASDLTDAFVEIKFGSTTYKTDVCAKSLNPLWNSEWFKFEVDDESLQDEPLQVRVLDHDTYSSHDAIGKVYIDVDPLLDPESSHQLGGWFPIFDTMHGIRGEILLMVKLELFVDFNQFKQSSCGFKFVCGNRVPECYRVLRVHGFVHDLLVEDDPEYKWFEKLRTPRASNEARQRLFSKMSGELLRRIGSKVEAMGGNAVVGFQQSYDIEGDSGIVIRGIGTAVTLSAPSSLRRPAPVIPSSDISATSKDFPFFTLTSLPRDALRRLSIVVCARAVKLLEKVHNQEEHETRELWWNEIRQEVKSHCLSLQCNAVIGYTEHATICDDVIVLSAHGTAAEVDAVVVGEADEEAVRSISPTKSSTSLPCVDEAKEAGPGQSRNPRDDAGLFQACTGLPERSSSARYRPSPINPNVLVPELLLTTVDLPPYVTTVGEGCFVQARFCRSKKKAQSESSASVVSDVLPFVEYELHKRLCNKIKVRGMNALFGYDSRVTIGENLVVGVASGTAVCLPALPTPVRHTDADDACREFTERCRKRFKLPPQDFADEEEDRSRTPTEPTHHDPLIRDRKSLFIEMEDMAEDASDVAAMLTDGLPPPQCSQSGLDVCPGVEGELTLMQSFLTLWRIRYDEDAGDEELNRGLSSSFVRSLRSICFRMRSVSPSYVLTALRFSVSIPDDDELQIWISGSVLVPSTPELPERKEFSRHLSTPPSAVLSLDSPDEVDYSVERKPSSSSFIKPISPILRRFRRTSTNGRSRYDSTSSTRTRHLSDSNYSEADTLDLNRPAEKVETTAMSFVPGRAIKRHVGALNIFIVRETTAVRGADEMIPGAEPTHGTGSSWFVTRTLAETQALIRAHVLALGGNALTSYRSSYSVFHESLTKNEAQCLLHVYGDVVDVT